MNKTNTTALLIIGGLLLMVLGGVIGVLYKTQQVLPQMNVIKYLSSQIIPSMVAYGEVTDIEGRNITLSYNGDSMKVQVPENSPVYSFVNNKTSKPIQEQVSFENIKKGDNVNVTVKLLPDGQLQSQSIFIIMPVLK